MSDKQAVLPPRRPSVYELVAEVAAEVGPIGKTQKNEQIGYSFRGIDDIVDRVQPAFTTRRMTMYPVVKKYETEQLVSDRGKTMRRVTILVEYHIVGPAGDRYEPPVTVPAEAIDWDDKATQKAMTSAEKVALSQLLLIPTGSTDIDNDGAYGTERPSGAYVKSLKQGVWLYAAHEAGYEGRAQVVEVGHEAIVEERAKELWGELAEKAGFDRDADAVVSGVFEAADKIIGKWGTDLAGDAGTSGDGQEAADGGE